MPRKAKRPLSSLFSAASFAAQLPQSSISCNYLGKQQPEEGGALPFQGCEAWCWQVHLRKQCQHRRYRTSVSASAQFDLFSVSWLHGDIDSSAIDSRQRRRQR